MRHRVAGYKLGRDTEHRRALMRNLTIALFTHGQITTTIPKAKFVKPFVERLITTAKRGDLAARRRVIKALGGNPILVDFDVKSDDPPPGYKVNKYGELLNGPRVIAKLFDELAPRYADRPGGYTRIIKLQRHRIGDGSDLCVLQLVSDEDSGPQVKGDYSRRREKANRRMEFAAKLRKGGDKAAVEPAAAVAEAPATEAPSEPVEESPQEKAE